MEKHPKCSGKKSFEVIASLLLSEGWKIKKRNLHGRGGHCLIHLKEIVLDTSEPRPFGVWAAILAHEYGHWISEQQMTDEQRRDLQFSRLIVDDFPIMSALIDYQAVLMSEHLAWKEALSVCKSLKMYEPVSFRSIKKEGLTSYRDSMRRFRNEKTPLF